MQYTSTLFLGQILNHPMIVVRVSVSELEVTCPELLETIVLPKNLNMLSSRLPKPNYSNSIKFKR